jgi:hypothetical protein
LKAVALHRRLSAEEREALRREIDAAARRQALEAEAEDLELFAADSREAPYQWPIGERRKRARWPEEAA